MTALITGAGGQVGRALAQHLGLAGWDLLLHYHKRADAARLTAQELREKGVQAEVFQADLSDPLGAEKLWTQVQKGKLGLPRLMVHCASAYRAADWETLTLPEVEADLRLEALSPAFLARALIRDLKGSNPAQVVFILDARMTGYDSKHWGYHLGKRLLWDLTRVLAQEGAPHVRVNALAPGFVDTGAPPPPAVVEAAPTRTLVTPQELAQAVTWILESPSMTGQTLFLDGGRSMKGRFYE